MRKRKKDEFYGQLSALLWPIVLQNLMSSMVSAADTVMLGFLNQSSLSAASLATQVTFIVNLFYAAFGIGTTVLAAQYWGKGDHEAVEKVLAITLDFSIAVSAVFFALVELFPWEIMRLFTNDQELISLGTQYLRYVGWSYLCMGISQMYLCIMKNSGRALLGTIYGSSSMLLNIPLNAVLIFGLFGCPQMGVAGAALATSLSRLAELLLVLWENTRRDRIHIRVDYMRRPDPVMKKDFVHYTSPVMANEIVWGGGITMVSVIMGHMGSDVVAANSLASVVKNIVACVSIGVGSASGIVVGNELGSGNLERAKSYGDRLCHMSIAVGTLSGLVLLAVSPLVMWFGGNLSETATGYLRVMLFICSYYMIGQAINQTTIGGIFCSGGDTRFGFLCDAVTMWIVIIPLGALAAFCLKLPPLWVYFLLNLDEFVKLPAVYRNYKKYNWVKNITR